MPSLTCGDVSGQASSTWGCLSFTAWSVACSSWSGVHRMDVATKDVEILVLRHQLAPRDSGRPPLPQESTELIRRLARENPRWGYLRIVGELKKLGMAVSKTSVATVRRRHRLPPAPRRDGPTWTEFLPSPRPHPHLRLHTRRYRVSGPFTMVAHSEGVNVCTRPQRNARLNAGLRLTSRPSLPTSRSMSVTIRPPRSASGRGPQDLVGRLTRTGHRRRHDR
jgi:hypothetical protein